MLRINYILRAALGLALFCASVHGHGTLTHPTPRGHFTADGRPNQIYENDPTVVGPNINPGSSFVCRDRPAATPREALQAGQNYNIRFDMSAPHVGSCALYISYDANKPATEMGFFKIKSWANCVSLNRQFIPTLMPAWLPNTDHAVLRWEWVATHVYPGLELFNQCADVRIEGGRPAGSPLPDTFTIGRHIPSNGNSYCNPYSGTPCTDEDDADVFPADATDPRATGSPTTAPPTNPPSSQPGTNPPTNPPSNPPSSRPPTYAPTDAVSPTSPPSSPPTFEGGNCAQLWGKCAGRGTPTRCCPDGARCNYQDEWYSQCVPGDVTGPPPTVPPTSGGGDCAQLWGKCAGKGTPTRCCPSGARCNYQSVWYSQCIPVRRGLRSEE